MGNKEEIEEIQNYIINREKQLEKYNNNARDILKKYLAPLYENTGNEWDEENDKDIEELLENIIESALLRYILHFNQKLLKEYKKGD